MAILPIAMIPLSPPDIAADNEEHNANHGKYDSNSTSNGKTVIHRSVPFEGSSSNPMIKDDG